MRRQSRWAEALAIMAVEQSSSNACCFETPCAWRPVWFIMCCYVLSFTNFRLFLSFTIPHNILTLSCLTLICKTQVFIWFLLRPRLLRPRLCWSKKRQSRAAWAESRMDLEGGVEDSAVCTSKSDTHSVGRSVRTRPCASSSLPLQTPVPTLTQHINYSITIQFM